MIEGAARLFAADANLGKAGPGTKGGPFYNPAMVRNRDLSVLLVRDLLARRGRGLDVADALAGAGARSIRLALEVDGDIVVHANDGDPAAVAAIEKGRAANDISDERLRVQRGGAHTFLAQDRYDVVDIDPYGSAAPFVDAGVRAVRHDGLLCLTATDTAALHGRYQKVCKRRYGATHQLHGTPWHGEVALRILAATGIQAAARYERAATPVLSVWGGHWVRIVFSIQDGRGAADRALAGLGATYAGEYGRAVMVGDVRDVPDAKYAGPLWTGPLHDAALVRRLAEADRSLLDPKSGKLVDALAQEADAPAYWLDPGPLAKKFGQSAPSPRKLITALEEMGHRSARSHMDPQGVRTDAPLEDLAVAWASSGKP